MTTKTTFWNLLSDYKINIPITQVDYKHGHEEQAGKQNKLLHDIHRHMVSNQLLHLNFVYGRVEVDMFTPIYGQKILTTLFLLHWYISLKENIDKEERALLDRFEYDTHSSSREFCHALIHQDIELPTHTCPNSLSDVIKNKYWYRNSWNNDPTIQSMLVMMDDMHQILNITMSASLWDSLTEDDFITFDLLDLSKEGYIQTDQLYLKMLARGKQITAFETFKANFILFLGKQYKAEKRLYPTKGEVSYANYFAYKIENEWTDLFWAFRNNTDTIDDSILNFMEFMSQLLYSKDNDQATEDNFINSFEQYEQVYSNEDNLLFLFDNLNLLHDLAIHQNKVDQKSISQFFKELVSKVAPAHIIREVAQGVDSYYELGE